MFVEKNFGIRGILDFGGFHLLWLSVWASIVTSLYVFTGIEIIAIPWLPLSLIGIAVAFYIGFKNNQAYDRLWEARKIWGAIVNSSRAWGSMIKAYVRNHKNENGNTQEDIDKTRNKAIYSHIAWLYTLREQLLIPTPWEHINQGRHIKAQTVGRIKKYGTGLIEQYNSEEIFTKYLGTKAYNEIQRFKNSATQIIDLQAQDLAEMREKGLIEDFRHMELQTVLNDFYVHQGKCERIKKFPLPRQYGSVSLIFVGIFIFLLPFGMIPEFQKLGSIGVWMSIPLTTLVSWVFLMMELVGDYSENPFEGLGNDIPMLSLCRTIEIDLLEMLREENIPDSIASKNGVLM